ncbi:laminin subunit alpha-4-like, partial [Saccoglossus kowalevskii]|uniref:Laminin subunit alpha-4-like n=1 Tax=Saccoglossus kowalevskii TaxID=10224 RepID=A0ABM0GL09_SACKO
ELARTSFDGCLLLEHKENYIKFGEPDRTYSTQPCTSNSEKGTFFAVDGGYIVQFDEFTVGLDLKIQIEIKPRVTSGTLLSVQSDRGDFLSMEMLDGNLVFSADNGEGIFSTTYEPNTNQGRKYLCDGEWHSIVALKAKNVVTLNVDGKEIMPVGIGRGTTINTDTKNELYIGGLPDGVTHKGITTTEQFVGCIKNLVIGSNIVNFNEAFRVAGAVQVNSCPTT